MAFTKDRLQKGDRSDGKSSESSSGQWTAELYCGTKETIFRIAEIDFFLVRISTLGNDLCNIAHSLSGWWWDEMSTPSKNGDPTAEQALDGGANNAYGH